MFSSWVSVEQRHGVWVPRIDVEHQGLMEKEGNQFIIVLSLYEYSPERLAELGIPLQKALQRISLEPVELAFRSQGRDVFAYLIRSKLAAGQIRAAVESPDRRQAGGFLTNNDQILVIALGDDKAASQGLSRALTWLQRH